MNIVRLPTQYSQHRTDSGRLSSGMDDSDADKGGKRKKVQQLQNVPRKIRDMFVAAPGHVLVAADYKAIEWGDMMWYGTKLPMSLGFHYNLLQKFHAGELDPHKFLASVFYSLPERQVTKRQRDTVKPYTYGYWQTAISVGRRSGHSDTVARQIGEAHEAAFRMNPIRKWMLDYVRKHKYAETALGFRRWFWEWNPKPEEVFAHFGQGTAADLIKWITLKMVKDYPWEMLTETHDNIVTQVPEVDAGDAAHKLQEIMEQPIPWMDDHSWRVDIKVGRNWREVS